MVNTGSMGDERLIFACVDWCVERAATRRLREKISVLRCLRKIS